MKSSRDYRIKEVKGRISTILQTGEQKGILTYKDLKDIGGDAGLQKPIMDMLCTYGAFSRKTIDRKTIYSFKKFIGIDEHTPDIESIVDWRLGRINESESQERAVPQGEVLDLFPEFTDTPCEMSIDGAISLLLSKGYMVFKPCTL